MKCPNDKSEMEKGHLEYQGSRWKSVKDENILDGLYSKNVTAWRCPKCGKVELYSEVNK